MKSEDILQAWLDALADAQPEFGRLLQSTLDEAGPLPAAGHGVIYTISHDDFVYGAALAKGFVTTFLEYKIGSAFTKFEEARKAKDEQAMVRAQDEKAFWSDVSNLANSRGAGRIRPTPAPAWVTRMGIVYEPEL